ncbi:MAG: non-ribosomal peptide synthetase, partial [Tumebacillaceae bacterium]
MKVENLEDIYELSPMQQGMLFHSILAPESGVYVQQFCFELNGDVDLAAFNRAWQSVIERHSVLRTAFFWEELEKPVQVVYQSAELPLVLDDWRGLSSEEQATRWDTLLQEDRKRGFDLTEAPVMRLLLIQTGESAYRFVWSHHHLLVDGWSAALLFKEVVTFYHAYAQGRSAYVEQTRPYGDYLAWLQEQDLDEAEAFWRNELSGFYAPTSPQVGRVLRTELADAAQETVGIRFTAEQTERIQAFARSHRITLNTLLQGAWGLLLSRYSGEEDVLFGVTVSGRSDVLEGAESMIGLFINTLPLRMQVSPEESVSAWLQHLQARQAEMRRYEYSPLSDVQAWSEVPKGTSLFESILVFENYPMDEFLLGQNEGLNIRVLEAIEQTNYPMTVMVLPGRELAVNVKFETARYEAATMTRLLEQLGLLVESMVEQPMQLLSELSLISQAEQTKMLSAWELTDKRWAQTQETTTIGQWFEAQATSTPDAVALEFAGQTMTYAELNSRSNRMARHLQAIGVGPEVLVGLCMDRSMEMVVGLLGILKAGGAYVPIDPTYPAERIALMLEDADMAALLTQAHLVEQLPEHQVKTVCVDGEWDTISQQSDEPVNSGVTSDNLAYMIYTSGSTGRPKAVMVEQGNFVSALRTMQGLLEYEASDVMPWITSIAFDIVQLEMLGLLLVGGKLVILKKDEILDFPRLVHQLDQFTKFQSVPTLMSQIVQELARQGVSPERESRVRKLLIGGEAVSPDLLDAMHKQYPQADVHILYGPTEATIWCTGYAVPRDVKIDKHMIGTEFPNARASIFDAYQNAVPVGVPGELYISGPVVTRGYYKREDITEERFVMIEGRRWYRTGDLVRSLADGNLEYLGRIDNQVKIRGFRIELGEIETVLADQENVREA